MRNLNWFWRRRFLPLLGGEPGKIEIMSQDSNRRNPSKNFLRHGYTLSEPPGGQWGFFKGTR